MTEKPRAASGWVVIDPAGLPCAWYSAGLAADAAAAFHMFAPAPARRAKLAAAGWAIRAGEGAELICNAPEVRASA
jgi:hypothetical protein